MRLAIAVVPLLAACAHAGKLAPLPAPDGPHGIVSIETRPTGARVVMERGGERYLACRKTPCRFEVAPGQWRVDMRKFLYRFPNELPSEFEIVEGEEARYVLELQGGFRSNADGGFLAGVLGLIVFVPGTIMAIHDGDAGWATMLGVPAASSAILVFPRLIWPRQRGSILSHERRRIDVPEDRGETQDQHGSHGGGSPADDLGASRVTSDAARSR